MDKHLPKLFKFRPLKTISAGSQISGGPELAPVSNKRWSQISAGARGAVKLISARALTHAITVCLLSTY